MLKTKRTAWLAVLLAIGLVVAACGDDDDTTSAGTAPAGDDCPTDVEGDVVVSGSSTVEPISAAVGEKTSLTIPIWAGWMHHFPSKPRERAIRQLPRNPSSSR